jgi:hypothetical protein
MAGIILIVALIGSIVLTLQRRENLRTQNVHYQISRNMENAIFKTRIIKEKTPYNSLKETG